MGRLGGNRSPRLPEDVTSPKRKRLSVFFGNERRKKEPP